MEKRRVSPLLAIFLVVLVDILGLTIIIPLLPFYAEKFGATAFQVGMLSAVYALCQLFAGPVLGKISDSTGRKPLLIVSQAGTLVGFVILAQAQSLWVIFVSRIIDGITAGNLTLAQAFISDVTEPKDRAKGFALIGIAFGIGFLLGPAISGYLAHFDYRYPIWVAAGLSALSIVASATLLPSARPKPDAEAGPGGRRPSVFDIKTYSQYFKRPGLGRLYAQFFCFAMSFSVFMSGFALFAERRFGYSAREVGYIYAYSGFLGIIFQGGMVGRLVKRFGEPKLVSTAFAFGLVAYALLAASANLGMVLIAATLSTFGHSALRPSLMALVSKAVGKEEQGVALGITQSLNSISLVVAPVMGSFLIEQGWLGPWALLSALASGIGLLIY